MPGNIKTQRKTGPLPKELSLNKKSGDSYERTEIDMALDAMEAGCHFIKVRSKRWQKTRHLQLSRDHLSLIVLKETCGRRKYKLLDLKKIKGIRKGHQSQIWETLGRHQPDEEQCFSLVLEDRTYPLNLVAINPQLCKLWVTGLGHLSSNLDQMNVEAKQMLWIWEHFKQTDKDHSNLLSYKEIKKLLDKLNFEASSSYIKKILSECDVSGDGSLSFQEFIEFFQKISWRPEIERLYKTYCDADLKLSAKELVRFFREDQDDQDVSVDDALRLITAFEPDQDFKNDNKISIYGFTYMLLSPLGDVFTHKHRKVHMDMTQPLSHYYIASSHNTYLAEDQLFGKSSVECYIRALERGCRCVELDCWDGEKGEPVIYHGYTLTSKIRFADVIQAVRNYAFKVSDYPVILSIENHCSIPQQNKMAEIMKDVLGTMLLTTAVHNGEECLPSPEAMKGKVLVKGKVLSKPAEDADGNEEDGEVSDEDEAADVEEDGVKKKHQQSGKKIKLSSHLSQCVVYAQSRHFKGFHDAHTNSCFKHISSLNEDKTESLITSQPEDFVKHNQWQLVRIYPKGSRTNSSNYSPLTMWNVGCQIVALNYQTDGSETYLNQCKFRTNGGCGYVLKPKLLLEGSFNPNDVSELSDNINPVEITIRIISAQQLPKPKTSKSTDVVDPYVVVSILGCDVDNQTQKTKVVSNNGFNPSWVNEEPLKFKVLVPELAFVEFKVLDKDTYGDDDLVGSYTVPMDSISKGYRHVHLETHGCQVINPATLFVNVTKKKLTKC